MFRLVFEPELLHELLAVDEPTASEPRGLDFSLLAQFLRMAHAAHAHGFEVFRVQEYVLRHCLIRLFHGGFLSSSVRRDAVLPRSLRLIIRTVRYPIGPNM